MGGVEYVNVIGGPVQTAYNYEVGTNTANTTYSAKIGLMYASDYGYAASPENWNTNMGSLNNDTNRNNNWMYMGLYEWTISRRSDDTAGDVTSYSFRLSNEGSVGDYGVNSNGYVIYKGCAVRSSFYLESNVELSGGTGTSSDPYTLAV